MSTARGHSREPLILLNLSLGLGIQPMLRLNMEILSLKQSANWGFTTVRHLSIRMVQ